MRVFLDTNIVIDYLSKREPFGEKACRIFLLSQETEVELCISALSFTTIYYVLRRECPHWKLLELLEDLRSLVTVLSTDNEIIEKAIKSDFSDFEDAVQYYTALSAGSNFIVTRNVKDYTAAKVAVLTPQEFLGRYEV